MNVQPDPEAVRELAHSLWEHRGKREGDAEKDWFEAERLLDLRRRIDDRRANESVRESFPASDPPAAGPPDKPPSNADAKWAAADAAKPRERRQLSGSDRGAGRGANDDPARKPAETPKLGSRDAPGG
jgi:hypothetical protein